MLLGCEPGNCHFSAGCENITNEYENARTILDMLGIWKGRLVLVQLPAFDGHQFIAQVMKLIAEIEQAPTARHARKVDYVPAQDITVPSHS